MQIVTQFDNLNASGYGTTGTQEGLFAPYDAKVIGDYIGLTPPYRSGGTLPGGETMRETPQALTRHPTASLLPRPPPA